jgi:hypothetical protein
VNEPKKRPSLFWMMFYGRRRRGFPWLLAAVFLTVLGFGLLFAIPGGADASRTIAAALFGLLLVGAIAAAVVIVLFPRRRP